MPTHRLDNHLNIRVKNHDTYFPFFTKNAIRRVPDAHFLTHVANSSRPRPCSASQPPSGAIDGAASSQLVHIEMGAMGGASAGTAAGATIKRCVFRIIVASPMLSSELSCCHCPGC